MAAAQQADPARAGTRQPSLVAGGERRRIERRLREARIWCHPEVSVQYQRLAQRAVLRGVESGGATKEIGRYVTFCDERGGQLGWLQPIDSIGSNGRHAVVIAVSLVSVEVFRVRNTARANLGKSGISGMGSPSRSVGRASRNLRWSGAKLRFKKARASSSAGMETTRPTGCT
jgi:hypothetical protein